jgi:hypothetical protein
MKMKITTFTSELHSFTRCCHGLSTDKRVRKKSINRSISGASIGNMEFIRKSTEHFTVCYIPT